jgi:hypothetical protein
MAPPLVVALPKDEATDVANGRRSVESVGVDLAGGLTGQPVELEAVDRLLDDPRFFEPHRAFFHSSLGRPSIPIETYLRLMFLKYR